VLEKITNECYRPLLDVFRANPEAKATVNINGVLLEMLQHQGASDVVEGFREMVRLGRWEVVGTSKYHVILPLIPHKEASRQITLQQESLKEYLDLSSTPRGFFPPEMCFSSDILPLVRDTGHEWLLISGTSSQGKWPQNFVGRSKRSNLGILFRDEIVSNKISFDRISPEYFIQHIESISHLKPRTCRLEVW